MILVDLVLSSLSSKAESAREIPLIASIMTNFDALPHISRLIEESMTSKQFNKVELFVNEPIREAHKKCEIRVFEIVDEEMDKILKS